MKRLYVVILSVLFAGTTFAQDPEIVDDILPEVQRLGGTARLNCTVANKQTNNLYWIHKLVDTDEIISSDSTVTVQYNPRIGGLNKYEVLERGPPERRTFMLIITRLEQQDAGDYECQVRIQNQAMPVSKTGVLIVQVPAKVRPGETTTLLEVDQGTNTTLVCSASGIPTPNITWARLDGRALPSGYSQFRGRNLPLNIAATEHMGVYRCVAYNNIKPPDEHLCEVRVFHAPTTRTVQNSVGQMASRQLNARLDCIVNGYPRPNVRWERIVSGGRQVLRDNDFFVNSKLTTDNQNLYSGEEWYTLKVKNVQANDYTDYFCVAENSKGSSEVLITLFETADCQGPNCPSLASQRAATSTLSALAAVVCFSVHGLLHLR